MKTALQFIIILLAFAAGYWLGRGSVEVTTTERVRIDTVFFERPQPVKILPPMFATVRIPRALFAPGDTLLQTVVVDAGRDSVELQVAIERHEYSDSTYRAQVSGPRIGELGPSLDWIQTYNRTSERVQTITKRSRFAVTAGVGVAYTPKGFQPYVGVGVGAVLWGF